MSQTRVIHQTGLASRLAIRAGLWRESTGALAPGYEQANMVILPSGYAFDFLRFCVRNPRPCPVLDVTDPGSPHPSPGIADDADIRTDLPLYRVYRDGLMHAEVTDINDLWDQSLVTFLLGCSYGFDNALVKAGIPVRHMELGTNNPMYITNRMCNPAGIFAGPLVVSMRPIPAHQVQEVIEITSGFPAAHGGPVHVGDPAALGIRDLDVVDYGSAVPVKRGEVPVFWACGVTPQAVIASVRLPFVITHAPGHMFILDRKLA
jgi:uncharacterized protein YcsI (UPF0317 family)